MATLDPYAKDLERWMPRLIAVWRRARAQQQGGGQSGRRVPQHERSRRPHPGARSGLWDARSSPTGPGSALTAQEVKEIAAGVKQLSHGLTRERELAGAKYLDDPKLLGAYLLFYWPVSYAQARQVFGELSSRPRQVLDLGSGPGPLSFAALDAGAAEVTAADRSKPALALARELATEAEEALSTRDWDPSRQSALPDGTYDFVVMGHVLNELFGQGDTALERRTALVEAALARVRKGGTVLILEPALRDTSRDLLQVRDRLVAKGYAVRAPCFFRGPCPALVKPSDWCHAERPWRMPAVVEQIARAVGLHKDALKMSYLALASPAEPWPQVVAEQRLFRIVSEPLEGKGRKRYIGCGPEGRVGLAMQEKHRTEANAPFFSLHRGDVLAVTTTETKGDGLSLDDRSTVRVIAPAGRPVPHGD